jgi:hypothetical protein
MKPFAPVIGGQDPATHPAMPPSGIGAEVAVNQGYAIFASLRATGMGKWESFGQAVASHGSNRLPVKVTVIYAPTHRHPSLRG